MHEAFIFGRHHSSERLPIEEANMVRLIHKIYLPDSNIFNLILQAFICVPILGSRQRETPIATVHWHGHALLVGHAEVDPHAVLLKADHLLHIVATLKNLEAAYLRVAEAVDSYKLQNEKSKDECLDEDGDESSC